MPPMPMSSSLLFDLQQSRSHLRSVLRYTAPLTQDVTPSQSCRCNHAYAYGYRHAFVYYKTKAETSFKFPARRYAAAVQIHPTKDPTQALGPVAPEMPIPSRTRVSPPLKQVQRLPARADVTV
ncbi:hypothetical protein HBH92_145250 [Parastagonospora nodorum]|nr:hypothetical protein HBH52_068370 [Parastagonospora nodorum]KAH3994913.1 hypothetical protein HBI10_180670 [Parastagonospora nodorum]KAH4015025.1 hypothetical protein HBI13_165800 [Parastagonospora nodorum]KAH4069587.1 hypothetical protein HBH50_101080 [Parastagonospora nodorum]KAH4089996.1 hypothetical protein HBH48_104860 [Parastagonospora nodorum]